MARNRLTQRRRSDGKGATPGLQLRATAVWTARLLATVGLTSGAAWGLWAGWDWACTSERFAVKQVEVLGTTRATPAELIRLSGLSARDNLWKLDTEQVEKAVAAHPWVKSVAVARRWPDGVVVTVSEHEPKGLLAAGELYLLNQDGAPFKRLQAGDDTALTLVTGVSREVLAQDRQAAVALLRGALDLDEAYRRVVGTPVLSEVHLEGGQVTLYTVDGTEIRLGEAEQVEAKLGRLKRVQDELGARRVLAIHLNNRLAPNRVTVTPAGAPPSAD